MAPPPWDFEGYWNAVIGSNRTPESTVAEFGFEDLDAIRDWLDASEKAAIDAGGEAFEDGRPAEWDAHNARAFGKLSAVGAD